MENKEISFKDVSKQHEDLIKTFNIPEWIVKQKCSKCDKEIGYLSLRSIGLKLNAQHIGNFFVEVCCQHCNFGYELYLKDACKNIKDLVALLENYSWDLGAKMKPDFLIPNSENNLVKDIIKGENNGNTKT